MVTATPEPTATLATESSGPSTFVAQPPTKLRFSGGDGFLKVLRKRVDEYFETTGRSPRDVPRMYVKTAVILAWFVATYVGLVFFAHHWWSVVPLAVSMGFVMAAIGFNLQHDASHKAYSDNQWVNRIIARTLDMIGGSSYLWAFKHNSIHHTYTNVHGYDDDINVGIFGRMAPEQRWLPFHRFQGIYLWVLYGFLAVKWHLFDDFHCVAVAKIGHHKIPRPKGWDLVTFIVGKMVFFSLAFVIPMLVTGHVWLVLGVYALAACVCGVVLAVVFQLAHCVEEAEFPVPVAVPEKKDQAQIENEWAIHQVETTVDFAQGSSVLCWFLGGLNFQIEHHLFHKISHIHYPALSKVVRETCEEFGIRYTAHKTFLSALASHARWLIQMGRGPTPAR